TIVVVGVIYYLIEGAQALLGAAAPWIVGALLIGLYLIACRMVARVPDLPLDIDVENPVQPEAWPTVQAGLHFLIPVGVLIWCLMVENLSPGLSAFYAIAAQLVLMLTQRPLIAALRGGRDVFAQLRLDSCDVVLGLNDGARSMIGIAVATG